MHNERNKRIIRDEVLFRRLVYCIEKGTGPDQRRYLQENNLETNNAIGFRRIDNINTNLKDFVSTGEIGLIKFKRGSWQARAVIDHAKRTVYMIATERTLAAIPKNKNRKSPHYLQSMLYVMNGDCIAKERQMTLDDFGIPIFDSNVLEHDFHDISQGQFSREDDYKLYVISYHAERGEIKSISALLLSKEFYVVDEVSLMKYIKPDFAKLSEIDFTEVSSDDVEENREHLVTIRNGVKPRLRENEKKA